MHLPKLKTDIMMKTKPCYKHSGIADKPCVFLVRSK